MLKRRMSMSIDEFVPQSNLSRSEQVQLLGHFKKTEQKAGGISFYDFLQILRNYFLIDERRKKEILEEIVKKEIRILDYAVLASTANRLKKQKESKKTENTLEENEYYDAFVALGGNSDGTGFVTKNKLFETMKTEFGLPIDINSTVQGLDAINNERLNFDEFCNIFQNPQNNAQQTLKKTDSLKSVKINLQDFDNYFLRISSEQSH